MHTGSSHLVCVMHLQPSKGQFWESFSDLVDDSAEIFMDDFTPYGNSFEEELVNLEKVLKICKQTHVSLSIVKFHMMREEQIVLGHLLSTTGIRVDPDKV